MICEICQKEFKHLHGLSVHLSHSKELTLEDYFLKYIGEKGICKYCGKETKFNNLIKGYQSYCDIYCLNKSDEHKEAVRLGVEKKYGKGVTCVFQSEKIKNKSADTLELKTGYRHNSYNPETIQRRKQTLKVTGKLSRELIMEANIKSFGYPWPLQSEEIKARQKQTIIDRYDVDNVSKLNWVTDKIKISLKKSFLRRLLSSDRLRGMCVPNFTNYDTVCNASEFSFTCTKCQNIFESYLDDGHIPKCPICYPPYPNGSSKYENEIYDWCSQYFDKIYRRTRFLLKDREIDIYKIGRAHV